MSSSGKQQQTVDTILAVMSEQMKTLLKSVDNIEKKLESKVDMVHFEKLEHSFEEHRKETQTAIETQAKKVNDHTVRLSVIGGGIAVLSWLSHFIK